MKEVVVLRYGHRAVRDYRVTSHCCLVARAFGAREILIAGQPDCSLRESIDRVTKKWGGDFKVGFSESWAKILTRHKKKGFAAVHLTMYGEPIAQRISEIRERERILVIVGSQKVEREVYEKADYNISITTQPHSEIAALAVFLDWFFEGRELAGGFANASLSVVPQQHGKKVERRQRNL